MPILSATELEGHTSLDAQLWVAGEICQAITLAVEKYYVNPIP